ncbi:15970_t:CDS:2, partial [Dentiscutata erythropus]
MPLSILAMLPGFNSFMYLYTIPTPLYHNGAYTGFTEFFKEYEILVDHIKYLTDDQLDKL